MFRRTVFYLAILCVVFASSRAYAQAAEYWTLSPIDAPFYHYSALAIGGSVDIDGRWAVVGSSRADVDDVELAGAADVFEWDGEQWTTSARLTARLPQVHGHFGVSTSIDGDRIVVGAASNWEDDRGVAYVFDWNGSSWEPISQFGPVAVDNNERFGKSVALDGDRVIVGAPTADVTNKDSGIAYIFEKDGDQWQKTATLQPSSRTFHFGTDVELEGDVSVVGSIGYDAHCYVFEKEGSQWIERARLKPWSTYHCDDAAVSKGRIAIGGRGSQGAAIFERGEAGWVATDRVQNMGPRAIGARTVALEGDLLVIGTQDIIASVHRLGGNGWEEIANLVAAEQPWKTCCAERVAVDSANGGRVLVGFGRAGTAGQGTAYVYEELEIYNVATEDPPHFSEASYISSYPNPFSGTTTIVYQLPTAQDVRIELVDLLGRQKQVLVNGYRQAGRHEIHFDGRGLPSGVYLCRISRGPHYDVLKLIKAN